MSLSTYQEVFKSNEIKGELLLEISLEDLDYLGISTLGHRKLIIKGVEDLRLNRRVTITAPSRASSAETSKLSQVTEKIFLEIIAVIITILYFRSTAI